MSYVFTPSTLSVGPAASTSSFDDTTAALGATNVQAAVDVNDSRLDAIEGADPVNIFDGQIT